MEHDVVPLGLDPRDNGTRWVTDANPVPSVLAAR